MRRPSIRVGALLVGVPLVAGLLVGAVALVVAGGDDPVSTTDPPAPPGPAVMGTVEGVVTDPAGEPVSDVGVLPRSLDTPAVPVPELGVMTGAAGRYEWHLRPGRYELVATAGDRAGPPRSVTVTAGVTVTLDLESP